jgi:hypothetical protein
LNGVEKRSIYFIGVTTHDTIYAFHPSGRTEWQTNFRLSEPWKVSNSDFFDNSALQTTTIRLASSNSKHLLPLTLRLVVKSPETLSVMQRALANRPLLHLRTGTTSTTSINPTTDVVFLRFWVGAHQATLEGQSMFNEAAWRSAPYDMEKWQESRDFSVFIGIKTVAMDVTPLQVNGMFYLKWVMGEREIQRFVQGLPDVETLLLVVQKGITPLRPEKVGGK